MVIQKDSITQEEHGLLAYKILKEMFEECKDTKEWWEFIQELEEEHGLLAYIILKEMFKECKDTKEWWEFIQELEEKCVSFLGEEWRDIKDYEGFYQVSNFGRVKSLSRVDSNNTHRKEKLMSRHKDDNGYFNIVLYKDGSCKHIPVHRLVAQAFIPNPNNYPIVNHIDENPSNNNADNLEWCTYKYNSNYGTAIERRVKAMINNDNISKIVLQLDKDTEKIIREFPSIAQIKRELGYDIARISKVCREKKGIAYGYKWRFKDE